MKVWLTTPAGKEVAYIVNVDPIFERSEEQAIRSQSTQIFLSLFLLLISLFVVLRISERLTSPLSALADQLRGRSKAT